MALRIVLMGTGEFALPAFRALMGSHHRVVALFTQPERTGRGHHRHVNAVRELALAAGIPVFQPERVNRPEILDQLRCLQADVLIVAAYGQILKPELLQIPRLGAYNLHGSILPRHRGAAPVQYSIRRGDHKTGVTIFRIEAGLDSGPVAGSVTTEILTDETSGELMRRLADLCVPLTLDIVDQLEAGTARLEPQDETQVTLAPRISRDEGVIDWHATSATIACHVRAMQPWPKPSTVLLQDHNPPLRCLVLAVRPADLPNVHRRSAPGAIHCCHNRMYVETGDGLLEVLKIQPEGRRAMDAAAFLNGRSLNADSHFANA